MRRWLFLFLAAALFLWGCKGTADFPREVKFEVTSTPSGKIFSGIYGNTRVTDTITRARTPQTYTTELRDQMDVASGVFKKVDPGTWQLTVKVYVNGQLKDQASTSGENGSITLSVSGMD